MRNLILATTATMMLAGQAHAADEVRGVTDKEIVIGGYADLSGVTVEWGVGSSNAYRMAFDDQNAKGGINGRKIRFIVEDYQYQVPRAVQATNKLINLDRVFLTVSNGGTPMNNATMPMQIEKNVPNVFPLSFARSMYEPFSKFKYALVSSSYDQIRAAVKYFVDNRGKKAVCVTTLDTDFGRDIMDGVHDQLKAMEGKATLAAATAHKPTDTDFSAEVAKMRDAKCDVIILGTIVRDTIQFVSAVRKTGWDVDMVGHIPTYDTAVAAVPGGATDGIYAMTGVLFAAGDSKLPEVQAFRAKYNELFKREPNFAAQISYTGAQVLIKALENAGKDLNVDTFTTAMEGVKNYKDIFGTAPLSFASDRHQGSNASFLARVVNGKWTAVSTDPINY
jgi:branched-chain amino acid transport system substrate-binding protein